jgi:hypothetical protein
MDACSFKSHSLGFSFSYTDVFSPVFSAKLIEIDDPAPRFSLSLSIIVEKPLLDCAPGESGGAVGGGGVAEGSWVYK